MVRGTVMHVLGLGTDLRKVQLSTLLLSCFSVPGAHYEVDKVLVLFI